MNGGGNMKRPELKDVTLVCVDTTERAALGERAVVKSLEQCGFGAVKFLTHEPHRQHASVIPPIKGMAGYSAFVVNELWKHFETSHCLVVQWDGYVLNGLGWRDEFLQYDYIGAPWHQWHIVGNGGFSLRSRRLCRYLAEHPFGDNPHPEDNYICFRHRQALEKAGFKFAPVNVGDKFAFEGRSYNGVEWAGVPLEWRGQFGFHSWLTPIPGKNDKPMVFHHSGDMGDVIYALAVIKAVGGGVLFLSEECKYPFPVAPKVCRDGEIQRRHGSWHASTCALARSQSYIWAAQFTQSTPFSADLDFNEFRNFYRPESGQGFRNIIDLHFMSAGLEPKHDPWLVVSDPVAIEGRPIVVNRTARYRNDKLPWYGLVRKYAKQMVFVGERDEWENFKGFGAPDFEIPWHPTDNLLELARVIAGAKVFIGNQSVAMAIALGLGKNVIQEVWAGNANCILKRGNAIYGRDANVDVPESWLK